METLEATELQDFKVDVCRVGYGFRTITVSAVTQEEAEEKALDQAGDYYYSEKTSEYVLEGGELPHERSLREQRDLLAASLQRVGQLLRFKRDGLSGQDHEALKAAEEALRFAGVEPKIFG